MRGTLTGQRYVDDILRPYVGPFLNGLPGAIFQQDNGRPHTARVSQDFLRHFQTLPWPARSPDLSPFRACVEFTMWWTISHRGWFSWKVQKLPRLTYRLLAILFISSVFLEWCVPKVTAQNTPTSRSEQKRYAAFHLRRESISAESPTSFPKDTSMPYSGFEPEPIRLLAECHNHHTSWGSNK
ncbi:DDE_3 domain-containing protein [Trichonephila clavipes]|nr:DDE_3 domain-containing protein [Trichonephila clavipes]